MRRVVETRIGLEGDKQLFVIDFEPFQDDDRTRSAMATATSGRTSKPIIQRNPHTGGIRCFFTLDPQGQTSADLRLVLLVGEAEDGVPDDTAEIWIYRWLG